MAAIEVEAEIGGGVAFVKGHKEQRREEKEQQLGDALFEQGEADGGGAAIANGQKHLKPRGKDKA